MGGAHEGGSRRHLPAVQAVADPLA